jgi:dedicator of cytokinesis protein 3
MLAFHETLETFFRKNFEEEMLRLSFDAPTERGVAASSLHPPDAPSYASSLADAISITQSGSSATRVPFALPSPPVPALHITPPQSPSNSYAGSTVQQPTRLQKHIAHLARHGMNAVASGPGEGVDGYHRTDSLSIGSPQGSFVNVTGTAGPSVTNAGAASIAGSKSAGSLKGRFSRLGSLSFGRRDGSAP